MIMILPLIVLAIGAIFAGFLFKDLFYWSNGSEDYFWGNSIKFLNPLSSAHPPLWLLLINSLLVTISIPISYYLFVKNKKSPNSLVLKNKPLYNFLVNKWYFDELYDFLFVNPSKKIGCFFGKVVDVKLIDRFGPDGFSN